MNKIKPLVTSILVSSALATAGFASDVLADQNNRSVDESVLDAYSNYDDGSRNYRGHRFGRYGNKSSISSWSNDDLPEIIKEQSNKALVEIALNGFYVDGNPEYGDRYIAEDYINHSPFAANGLDTVKNTFIVNRPEQFKAELDFMMADGEYVLGHSRFTGFTDFFARPLIAVDVYRVQNGKLVEHWDVIQEEVYPNETVSGNAMFPLEFKAEYVSEAQEKLNAEMVRNAVTGLLAGDESVLDLYYAEDYINHNPTAENGLDTLRGFQPESLPEGFEYEIGFVIADGPIVAMQTRAVGFGPNPVITFDIFRVSNNKIVEHWDVVQEEVPAENTPSGNPMFPIQ